MLQGDKYKWVIQDTFNNDPVTNFIGEYYDDEGWWAIAWLKAYDLTRNTKYLQVSEAIFADMTTGWDSTCNGG